MLRSELRSADRDNTSLLNDATTAGEGRRSTDLRSVECDFATGRSTRQFGYQREALVAINGRIPGTANDFGASAQGRNIGAPCPLGQTLVRSRLYRFKASGADAANGSAARFAVPEPASWAMLVAGFGLTGAVTA